jgi:peroxidase
VTYSFRNDVDLKNLNNFFDLLGDSRVNEQPLLTVMHTIWLREHNRIAENLCRIFPRQTDEFYFQHARRIVIAEMQHIIYNEYLPVIIGATFVLHI